MISEFFIFNKIQVSFLTLNIFFNNTSPNSLNFFEFLFRVYIGIYIGFRPDSHQISDVNSDQISDVISDVDYDETVFEKSVKYLR